MDARLKTSSRSTAAHIALYPSLSSFCRQRYASLRLLNGPCSTCIRLSAGSPTHRHRIAALAQRADQHFRIFRVRHRGNLNHQRITPAAARAAHSCGAAGVAAEQAWARPANLRLAVVTARSKTPQLDQPRPPADNTAASIRQVWQQPAVVEKRIVRWAKAWACPAPAVEVAFAACAWPVPSESARPVPPNGKAQTKEKPAQQNQTEEDAQQRGRIQRQLGVPLLLPIPNSRSSMVPRIPTLRFPAFLLLPSRYGFGSSPV